MALITMIIRKMIKNKWLVISLFLGMVMTTALVSTMPIYSEAILSRMLVKDLEQLQLDKAIYPGTYYTKVALTSDNMDKRLQILGDLDRFMNEEAGPGFQLPIREFVTELQTDLMALKIEGAGVNKKLLKPTASLKTARGIEEHVTLIDGRLPSDKPDKSGVYEVMVNNHTLQDLDFILGNTITLNDKKLDTQIKIRPVGVFEKKKENDLYFRDPLLNDYNGIFVMNENLFQTELVTEKKVAMASASWFFVLDYTQMELRKVQNFLDTDTLVINTVHSKVLSYQSVITVPANKVIEQYFERSQQLNKLMWSLNIPVLIMLGFYMFMVSNLIVDRQKNEIAVLRSRGATRWQVVLSFAVEGLILSTAALLAGPYIATMLTQILGASNGFLQFVNRASLPVHLSTTAFGYAAVAAAVSFLMMLIPVIRATRVTIVGHKQQLARMHKTPFWHKSFLDIILLAISIYGLYNFRDRLKHLQALGLGADDLRIDPLQFVVPALFIVGSGLLLLRLYPLLLRIIYRVGRKWWPPSLYATLIQVGRASSQYQFLMIFLIITMATGVFSAGAARTINNNTEERIRYKNGADFVLTGKWPNDAPPPISDTPYGAEGPVNSPTTLVTKTIHYTEPPFDPYLKLTGVEHAAKVFTKEMADFTTANDNGIATLIGIDTDDFGKTTWFSNHLLSYPIADYLNLIAPDSRAVLISKTLADQKQLKQGDTLWVSWDDFSAQPFIIYGILPYFPTFNPNPSAGSVTSEDSKEKTAPAPMLIVGHLSRIQLQLALEPYDVWLKMTQGFSTADFYKSIEDSKLDLTSIKNTREELTRAKNDPFMMALNGILTLGFLISILVTFVGFLLYWMLSLKGRTLQNGIMRAMGLSLRQLIGMLALEQLLTSGMALFIGVIVGNVTSRLFVPNFQIAFNPSSLVPPFRVILASGDFARLYVIVGFTLLLGLGILGFMLSRIRIHQALKLGED